MPVNRYCPAPLEVVVATVPELAASESAAPLIGSPFSSLTMVPATSLPEAAIAGTSELMQTIAASSAATQVR
jgi:hypothetical protein